MRFNLAMLVVALPVLGLAGASAAQGDRYGPQNATPTSTDVRSADAAVPADSAATPTAYQGPFLSWSGKSASTPNAAPTPPPAAPPVTAQRNVTYVPAPAPMSPRHRQDVMLVAPPAEQAPPPQPISAAPPPPAPAVVQAPPPAVAIAAPQPAVAPPQPAAPAPAVAAASPPNAPAQTLAQSDSAAPASPSAPVGVRYYSVLRDYGVTPDPVTVPADRPMVLIGPAADAAPPKSDDSGDSGKSSNDGDGSDTPPDAIF